ncbi:MAG: energy transducer TonB [Bradymonadia bacterium]
MSPDRYQRNPPDTGLNLAGILASALVNVGLFAGMAYAGMSDEANPPEPTMDVTWVEMVPKYAPEPEVKPKTALPDIIKKAPAPPPPVDNVIKTGEREEEKRKKAEEEKKRLEEIAAAEAREREKEREKQKQRERAEKRKRDRQRKEDLKKKTDNIWDSLDKDDRGVEDSPKQGRKDGLVGGNSNTGQVTEKQRYIARVNRIVGRQLKIPPIPREDRKKVVRVKFAIDADGKTSNPRVIKSSGNKSCDSAFVAAVRRFGEDAPNSIVLPTEEWLKKDVLRRGMVLQQKCGGGGS